MELLESLPLAKNIRLESRPLAENIPFEIRKSLENIWFEIRKIWDISGIIKIWDVDPTLLLLYIGSATFAGSSKNVRISIGAGDFWNTKYAIFESYALKHFFEWKSCDWLFWLV